MTFPQFLGEALSSLRPSAVSLPSGAPCCSSCQVLQLPALAWVSPNTTPEARPTCSGVLGSDPRGSVGHGGVNGKSRSQLRPVLLGWPLPRIPDPAGSFEEPHEVRTVLEGDSCPPSFKQGFMGINVLLFLGCARKTTEYSLGGFTQPR